MAEPVRAATTARLRLQGLRRRFGGTWALAGVDLELRAGEVHALLGENGAGKSTLVKIVAGAERPDSGQMWLDGRPYRPGGPLAARRLGVAMIYQELSLAPHLSVAENITLGCEPRRRGWLDRDAAARQARAALAELGHEEIQPDQRVDGLAPAAQQVVEIARSLVVDGRVLLLDEPTSSLGQADVQRLFALIGRLRRRGLAIVFISHFLDEALAVADRFTVLRDGRVVGAGSTGAVSVSQLLPLMAGRSAAERSRQPPRSAGRPVLEARAVAGRRRPVEASFILHEGEVLGVAGLMGSGRTELLRVLFGLDPLAGGQVLLRGRPQASSPARCWRAGMGLLSESRQAEGLALNLAVDENIVLSRLEGLGPPGMVLPARRAQAARRWIERLGIRCQGPEQPVGRLSGGNQQRVALARLLHHDASVLLLDEPTRGIDVGSKEQIYALIDALARQGKAILMTSSHVPELLRVADRIGVMWRGRLLAPRPAVELDEHRLLAAATTGEELR